MTSMKSKEKKEFEKRRKNVIKELDKLGKKHGEILLNSAMNRKLVMNRQRVTREKEIARLTNELDKIKQGKPI